MELTSYHTHTKLCNHANGMPLDYLQEAKEGDFCFVEDGVLPNQGIEKFYVFCWNRNYPGDVFFEYDLKGNGFKKEAKEEFAGSSHDKIFLEVYSKKE
jgi:histidinol phosphatase-like PHP family hydrolase